VVIVSPDNHPVVISPSQSAVEKTRTSTIYFHLFVVPPRGMVCPSYGVSCASESVVEPPRYTTSIPGSRRRKRSFRFRLPTR
jgi:hypothetical protein